MHVQGEEGDTVYEWMVREDGGGWRHWRDRVPQWIYPSGAERPNFAQMLIPTLDSVRYEHLLRLVYSVGKVWPYSRRFSRDLSTSSLLLDPGHSHCQCRHKAVACFGNRRFATLMPVLAWDPCACSGTHLLHCACCPIPN